MLAGRDAPRRPAGQRRASWPPARSRRARRAAPRSRRALRAALSTLRRRLEPGPEHRHVGPRGAGADHDEVRRRSQHSGAGQVAEGDPELAAEPVPNDGRPHPPGHREGRARSMCCTLRCFDIDRDHGERTGASGPTLGAEAPEGSSIADPSDVAPCVLMQRGDAGPCAVASGRWPDRLDPTCGAGTRACGSDAASSADRCASLELHLVGAACDAIRGQRHGPPDASVAGTTARGRRHAGRCPGTARTLPLYGGPFRHARAGLACSDLRRCAALGTVHRPTSACPQVWNRCGHRCRQRGGTLRARGGLGPCQQTEHRCGTAPQQPSPSR